MLIPLLSYVIVARRRRTFGALEKSVSAVPLWRNVLSPQLGFPTFWPIMKLLIIFVRAKYKYQDFEHRLSTQTDESSIALLEF